jgi:hypothetical protein
MGTWGTILVIVIAMWGGISHVLEQVAKKAKEKKQREAEELRRTRELGVTIKKPSDSGSFEQHSDLPVGAEAHTFKQHHGAAHPAPPPSRTRPVQQQAIAQRPSSGRESDLAARRRAQLEQLRQRRGASTDPRTGAVQARLPGQGGALGRPNTPTPMPTARGPQRAKAPGAKQGRVPQQPYRGTHQMPIEPVPTRQPKRQPAQAIGARPPQTTEELIAVARAKSQPADAYAMPTVSAGLSDFGGVRGTVGEASMVALRKLLSEPDSLRQAILLKEVLDAPISLRTDPEHGYLAG